MKKCLWCNNEFSDNSTFNSGGKTYYDKFCSNKCRSGYSKEYGEPTYKKSPNGCVALIIIALWIIFVILNNHYKFISTN
jgi:hypothetical protein